MRIEHYSRESKALNLLRFPLACLIVLLHTGVSCGPENWAWYIPNFVAQPIVVVAVPAFFFISGYLFFMNKEQFGVKEYGKALRKKIKSLLAPYIIWNTIAYVLSIVYEYLTTKSIQQSMSQSIWDIYWPFGGLKGTSVLGYQFIWFSSPCAGVLWFLRDLMTMMVCSIFTYPIIKRLKWWLFPILFIINALRLGVPYGGFSIAAMTFFHMGAFYSIHNINVFEWIEEKRNQFSYMLWPCFIVMQIGMKILGIELPSWLNVICLTAGIAFVFKWAYDAILYRNKTYHFINKWGETSFFTYTFVNTQIVWFINKEPGYLLDVIPYIGPLLCYLFLFSIRIIESIIVFYTMKKYCPTFLSVLIGGRFNK